MNKNFIPILISLLIIPLVWYNLNKGEIGPVAEADEPLSEQEEAELFGEEVKFCSTEIPIGEAIEGAWHFACQFSQALSNIQQASLQYRNTVKEIAELASQCSVNSCLPNCVPQTVINDNGTPDDPSDDFDEQICITQACSGDPCPRAEIENKYAKLANISRILDREKETVNRLLDTERPEIKEKLDQARRLLEFNAPTPEQYLFTWFTPCETAVTKGWVELEDFQEGLVCKSPYNYLVCR